MRTFLHPLQSSTWRPTKKQIKIYNLILYLYGPLGGTVAVVEKEFLYIQNAKKFFCLKASYEATKPESIREFRISLFNFK
jgi:hypothetical protein